MKQEEIVNFRQEGMLITNPTEDGTYITIRAGLTGIYKMINIWEITNGRLKYLMLQ